MTLEKDKNGNIITHPVIGWITGTVAESAVLLAIQYAETPLALEKGEYKSLQLVLNPQESIVLAEALKKQGTFLLEAPHGKPLN